MPAVDRLEVDGGVELEKPTWKAVKNAIADIEGKGKPATLTLSIADYEGVAILSFVPGLGFFLVARQSDENAVQQLIQSQHGEEIVKAIIANHEEPHPRFVFVERALALAALQEFHAHGQRARDLSWMDTSEILERYIIPSGA